METNNQLYQLETLKRQIYGSFGAKDDFVIMEHFTTVSNSYTDEFAFAIVDKSQRFLYLLADVVSTIDEQELIARARHIPTVYGYLFVGRETSLALNGEYKISKYNALLGEIHSIDFDSDFWEGIKENNDSLKRYVEILRETLCSKYGVTKELAEQLISVPEKSRQKKRRAMYKGERLYRYMSNEAFFRIIYSSDEYQRTLTYGLSSICSMNDRWEYSFGRDSKNNRIYFRDSSVRDTHIMSLSKVSPRGTLDMWRLYGDDAKGICLEFEVMAKSPVYRVRYIRDYQGLPYFPFYINCSGQWYAFPMDLYTPEQLYSQKSADYELEKEARLIVIKGRRNNLPRAIVSQKAVYLMSGKWINSSGTPFPLLMMEECLAGSDTDGLFQAPLVLKRVFIGPNASDQALKKAMILKRLSELNVNVPVEIVKDFGYKPTK